MHLLNQANDMLVSFLENIMFAKRVHINSFSVLKNGNQCYCFEEMPLEDLDFVNDIDEPDHCNISCVGSSNYLCGGAKAYTAYIASK